jgi:hypothetical protein
MEFQMTFLTTVLAQTDATASALPTWVFGAIALVVFAILGFVVFSYRDVAGRHPGKAEAYAKAHSGAPELHGGH